MTGIFWVGSAECRVLPDGAMDYEPESLYSNLPPEAVDPAVRPLLNQSGLIRVPYHPLLVRTTAGLVLIDAGAGAALAAESGAPIGELRQALDAAAIPAEDIALVLLSHAHPDHIGGLTEDGGHRRRLAFPAARHVISRAEFDYWTSDRVPGDFAWMGELAKLHLTSVDQAGMLDLVDGEEEVAPGIGILPAPGHTPGHVAISISGGAQQALFLGDAVLGEPNFAHPDWTSILDTDRAEAVRSRRRLLDAAARDAAIVAGYHMWEPGMVERHGEAYRWMPGL